MRLRLGLMVCACVGGFARAQSPYYVYSTNPLSGTCVYPGASTVGVSPVTKLIADDVLPSSAYAGQAVTAVSATLYNYAGNLVSFRTQLRFWQANGANSPLSGLPGPGTYLSQSGNIGFLDSGESLASKVVETLEFSIPSGAFTLPSSRFWVGMAFDNASNATGYADTTELNYLGVMPAASGVGSSGTGLFRSGSASDLFGVSNPSGAYETGNLAIGIGVAGQDFHGTAFLNDVTSPMAQTRTITLTAKAGSTVLATKTIEFSSEATSNNFWITLPAVLPTGSSNPVSFELSGRPFLRKTVTSQVPVPPSATPVSINLGNVTLTNGDVDGSGEVDAADIDAVIAAFGQVFPGGTDPYADVDCSGEVDAADIDIVIANFGAVDN